MIDFKVDESLCVSCGACVKDCLHQALRMDTYPVMVDEGHCIRCQHCLAVCPTGAVSIMGAAASDCTPLAGNIPEPRQLDTLFKGRRSVRHYKRENVSPGLLQELLDSAAYAPTGSNAQNLLVSVVDDIAAMDALREAVYLWTSWRKRVPCRTASAARFSFPPESSGRPGDGTAFSAPLRIA